MRAASCQALRTGLTGAPALKPCPVCADGGPCAGTSGTPPTHPRQEARRCSVLWAFMLSCHWGPPALPAQPGHPHSDTLG